MKSIRSALLALIACVAGTSTAFAACRDQVFQGQSFTICDIVKGTGDLRLFLSAPDGTPLGSFERVDASLAPRSRLRFAMNAGMYHADRTPVGLFIAAGRQVAGLVTAAGPGNFGLLPNGVFCIGADRFGVIESRAFADGPKDCTYASQSGPMLVIGGALHPRFLPDATSRNIRNGVGVSADGQTAIFAISNQPVSFYEFARLFRDQLHTPNALYFDGSISRLYAPELGRADPGLPMGPIVGLVISR